MVSSKQIKHKTHSDKFPLTLHSTGQYCKKIRGENSIILATIKSKHCNAYLDSQETRVISGEIKARQSHDQQSDHLRHKGTSILDENVRVVNYI
jgi:hypothetical protein